MFVRNDNRRIKNTGLVLVVLGLLFLANSFSLRAQVHNSRDNALVNSTECRFFYPFDSSVFSPSYLGNAQTISKLDSLFSVYGISNIHTVEVLSYSSPEGNFQYNVNLSARRAEALRNFIIAKYPSLSGKITLNPGDESWNDLRSNIVNDSRISQSSRAKMLEIIDSNDTPDVKERKLSEMPIYKYLYANYFKKLRFAALRLMFLTGSADDSVAGRGTQVPAAKAADQQITGTQTAAYLLNGENAVYFKQDNIIIEPEYMGNSATLDGFRALLDDASNIETITIVGYSSPDGPAATNARLSSARAKALFEVIESEYPELAGRVKVISGGEDWDGLRSRIAASESMSVEARESLLGIIDSNDALASKKAQIKARPEFDVIANEILPLLRRSTFSIKRRPAKEDVPVAEPAAEPAEPEIPSVPEGIAPEVEDEQVEVKDSTLVLKDTTIFVPKAEMPKADPSKPLFAVSTNVVYDLGGLIRPLSWTPNISIEVPVSKRWSVFAEYTFPWWVTSGNNQAWQILKWDIGSRYWMSNLNRKDNWDILRGHFIGIDLGAGYYDIEPEHKGWQGEFQTVGLEYGYAFKLAKQWRLDAYVGAGWMGTHYRQYQGSSDDQHLLYQFNGKMTWFGPTKAGISIKYLFNSTRRSER